MYQFLPDTLMGPATCIKRLSDNAFIPFNPANTDYQEYLKWLEAGNTPLPTEEDMPLPPPQGPQIFLQPTINEGA